LHRKRENGIRNAIFVIFRAFTSFISSSKFPVETEGGRIFLQKNCFVLDKKPQLVNLFKEQFETKHGKGPAVSINEIVPKK
jgi:hypothetical protein